MQLVVGVAMVYAGRVLAARRSYPPEAAGLWEFPGGKVEAGETPEVALVREIAEELDCLVAVTAWLEPGVQIREGLVLRVATASLVDGEPIPRAGEHDAVRWLAPDALADLAWMEADRPFVETLGRT
jgi:8-oxo-dGTP diphosphatase